MDSDLNTISRRIIELQIEHRDLDFLIDRLATTANHDELQLRRLKKRRLKLKDTINGRKPILLKLKRRKLVLGVGHPAGGATPDTAATGGIGNDEALAKQLRDTFRVRRLAAALTCTGELQHRQLELRALSCEGVKTRSAVGHPHGGLPKR